MVKSQVPGFGIPDHGQGHRVIAWVIRSWKSVKDQGHFVMIIKLQLEYFLENFFCL